VTHTIEDRVAQTILDQIGVPNLMRLGAHDVTRYLDAVRFKVRIAKPGQSRARIMQAQIALTPMDYYDVSIGMVERPSFDWYSLVDHKGIDAEAMVSIMTELAARA